MAIQILSEPPPEPSLIADTIRQTIEAAMPNATVAVAAVSAGHFEIDVLSDEFEGMTRVKQQQRVYAAIRELMAGDSAPVHAIDRMITRTA
jgi:acid stress-induced BolA-like protein IbaG/YrbA